MSKQLLAMGALALACSAQAQTQAVAWSSIQGPVQSFESLVVSDPLGSLIDGLLVLGNLQFGERFAGQELATAILPRPGSPLEQDRFDDLGFGLPSAGLSLLAGSAGANLGVYDYGDAGGKALAGIGPGLSNEEHFGFGAISVRFAAPAQALGFQIREADGGDGWLALYRDDGSLIQRIQLGSLSNGSYAFARSGGAADIAGFSLYHRDAYYGIAIDNLVVGSVVPEPQSALLLAGGLLAVGLLRRRNSP